MATASLSLSNMSSSSLGMASAAVRMDPEGHDTSHGSAIEVFIAPEMSLPLSERPRPPTAAGSHVSNTSAGVAVATLPSNDDLVDTIVNKRPNARGTAPASPSPRMEQFQVAEQAPATPLERAIFHRNRLIHSAAICWVFFASGWNDGSTGPLIPKIQEHYHIGFVIVSLIFVCACAGFMTGALLNVYLVDKLGFGKALTLGSAFQLAAYIMQSPGGPFPLLLFAYSFSGFGLSIQISQGIGFIGSYDKNSHIYTAVIQACYGLGAFAAPLSATHFIATSHWSFHYVLSACFATINIITLLLVFRLRTQDEVMAEAGQAPGESGASGGSKYRQIMVSKRVQLLALWALVYVGMEFTLGGWIVTFVIEKRHGGTTAGYISSGFFGGLTIGRVALMWLNKIVGEHRVFYLYMVLAVAFEATVWAIPSLVENGIAVAAVGVLLGPMFPIMINIASRILPPWLLISAFGWITGVGQVGTAALPFVTGVLAEKYGISSLQPLLVAMMLSLIGIWSLIPTDPPRID